MLLCLTFITTLLCNVYGNDVRFLAVGDWGDTLLPGQGHVAAAMDEYAAEFGPDFIVSNGDNFYPSGVISVDDRQWDNKWRYMYNGTNIGELPWYISVGNHDYSDRGWEWNQVELSQIEPRWILPNLWHSFEFEIGDSGETILFLAVDTEGIRAGSNNYTEMLDWIDNTLANSNARWKIMYGHRPIYSVGNYGPWSSGTEREFQPFLEEYDVDIYMCGHDHNMQHLKSTQTGIDYVISGAGGALWYSYEEENEIILEQERGILNEFFVMDWGFTSFIVTEDAIHVEYVTRFDGVLYSFDRTK